MRIRIVMSRGMWFNILRIKSEIMYRITKYLAEFNTEKGVMIRSIIAALTPDMGIVLSLLLMKFM